MKKNSPKQIHRIIILFLVLTACTIQKPMDITPTTSFGCSYGPDEYLINFSFDYPCEWEIYVSRWPETDHPQIESIYLTYYGDPNQRLLAKIHISSSISENSEADLQDFIQIKRHTYTSSSLFTQLLELPIHFKGYDGHFFRSTIKIDVMTQTVSEMREIIMVALPDRFMNLRINVADQDNQKQFFYVFYQIIASIEFLK